jgi:ACS family hexuronate transporter-like MFS transporter
MRNKPIRWKIAFMLCLASGLSYLDRNTLAVLASTIQADLGFSDMDYANITAAFVLSYTIMYAVSGRLVDRIGTRKGFSIAVGGWSLVSMLHGLAHTVAQFSLVRFFLGITESANFPAGVKAVTEWFPIKERALAIGIFNAGAAIGAAVAVPIVSYVALYYGWRIAFIATGAIGFVWLIGWIRYYHLPEDHPRISEAEKKLILEDGEGAHDARDTPPKISIKQLLKRKETWGCFSARIFIDPVTYFLLFWIPKYLQDKQGFSLQDIGATVWIPYAALGIGTILGGAIPKWLIEKQGWSLNKARKSVMLFASVVIPAFCYLLYARGTPTIAICAIAGIMFAHGLWSNITLPTEIYPKRVQATITGLGGTLGGITGFASQSLIGITIGIYSYLPMFIYVGFVYLFTFLLVVLLIGKLGFIRKF